MKTDFEIETPAQRRDAFTYVELLAVVGILLFCTFLILPAVGRTKSNSLGAQCLNNLQQLSSAINMYAVDNEDTLPGPCWTGMYGHYDSTSQIRFGPLNYIAPYLGLEASSPTLRRAEIADCPGSVRFRKTVPPGAHLLATNVSYHLSRWITNNLSAPPPSQCAAPVQDRFPFGYPSKSVGSAVCASSAFDYPGMKIGNIKFPGKEWAITDVDGLNSLSSTNSVPGGANYGQFLPSRRVHGNTRNYLFFDGRAAAVKD